MPATSTLPATRETATRGTAGSELIRRDDYTDVCYKDVWGNAQDNPVNVTDLDILAISLLNNTGMFWVGEATTESFLYRNVCLCYINHDDDNGVHAHDWEAGWAANYIAHRNSFVPNGENCCGDAAMW